MAIFGDPNHASPLFHLHIGRIISWKSCHPSAFLPFSASGKESRKTPRPRRTRKGKKEQKKRRKHCFCGPRWGKRPWAGGRKQYLSHRDFLFYHPIVNQFPVPLLPVDKVKMAHSWEASIFRTESGELAIPSFPHAGVPYA